MNDRTKYLEVTPEQQERIIDINRKNYYDLSSDVVKLLLNTEKESNSQHKKFENRCIKIEEETN